MQNYVEASNQYIMDTYGRFPLAIHRGEGCYLFDEEGKKYLDFCAGIATNALGYGFPKMTEALKTQIDTLMHVSNLYYTKPQVEAAKLLVEHTDMKKVFFCNSGTEANEAALKLARKWGKQQSPMKHKVITMANSFHGRTYGSLSATGQKKYQKAFTPMLEGFMHVPFNDCEALEEAMTDDVCAVMIEVIQGEGGIKPIEEAYARKLQKLCEAKNVLLIVDEVQTGIGRCGSLFAYMQYGIQPDIVTSAKGLGGGMPIGAMLCNEKANVFEKGDHAATFGGNPLATTAAKVVLETLLQDDLLKKVKEMGAYLRECLEVLKAKYPVIEEVRGAGLMQAIELKVPARSAMEQCIEKGLIVVGSGEKVIRFLPPLIIEKIQIDEGMKKLEEAVSSIG